MSSKEGDFENKRSPQEKTYYLSKIVTDGGCIHCLNKSCRNKNIHGIEFPEKLSCFVKNPRFITEVATTIENASSNGTLNFNDIPFNITTCTFIHTGNCKNCNEGRYKTFDMNGSEIGVCFPAFDETKTKIIVGIHMDIKIIMRGRHYAVSALPILEKTKIIRKEKESVPSPCFLSEDMMAPCDPHEKSEDSFDFSSVLNIYENSKQKKRNNKYDYYNAMSDGSQELTKDSRVTHDLSLTSIYEFPSLTNTPCSSPLVVLENSPTKKNFADIIKSSGCGLPEEKENKVLSAGERVVTPISLRISSTRLNEMKDYDNRQEFNRSPDSDRSFTPITADGFEGQNIILKQRLEVLRKENAKLQEENKVLEMTNNRNLYVIENKLKIDEFLKNRNLLNNSVIEQFFNTHYGDYLVIN